MKNYRTCGLNKKYRTCDAWTHQTGQTSHDSTATVRTTCALPSEHISCGREVAKKVQAGRREGGGGGDRRCGELSSG